MRSVLIILAIFSILFGFITKDIFVGLGTNFFFMDNSNEFEGCTNLLLCWWKFNSTKCTIIIFNSENFVKAVKFNYCTIKLYPSRGFRSFLTCESYLHISMLGNKNLILLGQWRYSSFIWKQPQEALMKNNEQLAPLDPWFVTGFADAEGSFSVSIYKNAQFKVGWRVLLIFSIGLHEKDQTLLQEIKNYFSVGSINWKHGLTTIQFRVVSIENLQAIINHFDKYPLITNKWADYQLFKQTFQIIQRKEHLTLYGLRKIVGIRASMNQGLSLELKRAFPDVVPVSRPEVINPKIYDPNLLAGFTAGEGSFMVIIKSRKNMLGYIVSLEFTLTQHSRDKILMKSLIIYLSCGNTYRDRESFKFVVRKFRDITQKIIPFFKKTQLKELRRLILRISVKSAELMKEKKHLTKQGLEKIK